MMIEKHIPESKDCDNDWPEKVPPIEKSLVLIENNFMIDS
mgnify:CR=1 FL=1